MKALVTMDCIGTTVTVALSAADLGMQMESWASTPTVLVVLMLVDVRTEMTGMTNVAGGDR